MSPSPDTAALSHGRILVRGVNWLGDAVMTTPALLRLRERYPEAHIALLTPKKLAGLWEGHQALNEVLAFSDHESAVTVARRVRAQAFDVGLILPNSFRSAVELWLARIPRRLGYAGQLRTWLLTEAVPRAPEAVRMRKRTAQEIRRLIGSEQDEVGPTPNVRPAAGAHHIFQYLRLTARLGAAQAPRPPEIHVTPAETGAVLQRFGIQTGLMRPLLGINAGAEYGPAKRWPIDRFIAAAAQIEEQSGCLCLVLGGPGDTELAGELLAGLAPVLAKRGRGDGLLNLAGKTSLRELCAVLRACDVVLTNDTGPMHVAAAVGTSVVVPFGSTSPELTGPGQPGDPRHQFLRASTPCAPCFLRACPIDFRCMRQIQVEEVVHAVLKSLRTPREERRL